MVLTIVQSVKIPGDVDRKRLEKMAGKMAPQAQAQAHGGGSHHHQQHSSRLKGLTRLEPSQIEYKSTRFLITDRPDDMHIQPYIEELQRHNVKDVVRVCEPSYDTEALQNAGISVLDLEFEDGTFPPAKVVDAWFDLLNKRFREDPGACVAVHCVAGLGRAPVLVCLALIELGMKYEDAVDFIRQKRRGAINAKQLVYLEKYRAKSRLKTLKNGQKHSCVVQ
jgi:protein tyrosine phosphatase type 4A